MKEKSGSSRRKFLKGAGLVSGLLGLGAVYKYRSQYYLLRDAPEAEGPLEKWQGAEVQSYRPLGRTGWNMSDISFGAGRVSEPDVVRAALDRGINYIDTSPDYSHSLSEKAVGEAIQGRRDQVFVASKFCSPDGHLDEDASVSDIIESVEGSLRRLKTDHLDLIHIHACNTLDRLEAPTFHEAFDRLKEQGKARFLGVSSHTPDLETVMDRAVDSGRFDVVMVAYNFKNWPKLDAILDKAQQRGVGFVAMKTLKGAYHTVLEDFTPDERNSFAQAAFKWVNNDPRVSGLVVSFTTYAQLDEYLYASGEKLSVSDLALLEKYDRVARSEYCRPGCGECLDACPAGLPIDDLLRYTMYHDAYGAEREAVEQYARTTAKLGYGSEVCAGCAAPCEASCPFDIPIRKKLTRADEILRLRV